MNEIRQVKRAPPDFLISVHLWLIGCLNAACSELATDSATFSEITLCCYRIIVPVFRLEWVLSRRFNFWFYLARVGKGIGNRRLLASVLPKQKNYLTAEIFNLDSRLLECFTVFRRIAWSRRA